jgi:predicted Fe-S protein YdhL (DUF1289 family)
MANPCIDVCRHDPETGFCFGCGMSRKDRKHWKKDKDQRAGILAALPGRLVALAAAGHRTGRGAKKA